RLPVADMPELERFILHRLSELDAKVRQCCDEFDFHTMFTELHNFCAVELSAFYFDIRKDALYCDRADSDIRRAARTVLDELFSCLTAWLAPIICFTAEEAWLSRFPDEAGSVHLRQFPDIPDEWRDEDLAGKWDRARDVRRVVTGVLEKERAAKHIGSSLQARPVLYIKDHEAALGGIDWAEICITSDVELVDSAPPSQSETSPETPGVGVNFAMAEGEKCQRCWKVLPEVGAADGHADLCGRCADAVEHHAAAAG
ncbi:MAG: class I tRNA ligase family protein, partial [Alphaproteobacteria bacterium]